MSHSIEIVFVTGKGGVGKTEVACRLAEYAASKGHSTLIVEMNGSTSLNHRYGKQQTYDVQQIKPNLHALSINAEDSIREYAIKQLKFKKLYKLIFENRYVKPLINGAPGLYDAVQMGKIYELNASGQFDYMVVDAPATGHCLTMLESAKTLMDLTKFGPMFESNKLVENIIGDREKTGLLLTTTLEELPIRETIDLYDRLAPARRLQVIGCVANKCMTPPISLQNWTKQKQRIDKQNQPWLDQATRLLEKASQEETNLNTLKEKLNTRIETIPLMENQSVEFDMKHIWEFLTRSS